MSGSLHEYDSRTSEDQGERQLFTVRRPKIADMETASLSTNPQFMALIERSRVQQTVQGSVSAEEMRERLGR